MAALSALSLDNALTADNHSFKSVFWTLSDFNGFRMTIQRMRIPPIYWDFCANSQIPASLEKKVTVWRLFLGLSF
jgi:lysozyme family protein